MDSCKYNLSILTELKNISSSILEKELDYETLKCLSKYGTCMIADGEVLFCQTGAPTISDKFDKKNKSVDYKKRVCISVEAI